MEHRVWIASDGSRELLLNNPLAALLVAIGDSIEVEEVESMSNRKFSEVRIGDRFRRGDAHFTVKAIPGGGRVGFCIEETRTQVVMPESFEEMILVSEFVGTDPSVAGD